MGAARALCPALLTVFVSLFSKKVPEFRSDDPVAVLGDIHGCASALEELLTRLGTRPVFVLGDICDRGPDTRRCFDLLIERKAKGVLGNHEEWFLDWAVGGKLLPLLAVGAMGARATFESYGVRGTREELIRGRKKVPRSHIRFLQSLEHVAGLQVAGESYWLVHAGVDPLHRTRLPDAEIPGGIVPHIHASRSPSAHWSSSGPEGSDVVDRPVIMGHKCVQEPLLENHVLAIDTGAGTMPWGRLSALLLPERRILSVSAPGTASPR